MRLVTYSNNGSSHAGVLTDAGIVPVGTLDAGLPDDVLSLIKGGDETRAILEQATDNGNAAIDPANVKFEAPIKLPERNIFCVGKNYTEHAKEFERSGFDATSAGQDTPDRPIVFTKAPSSVTGPTDTIDSTMDPTGTIDYEGELAVVIGTGGRGIKAADAMKHIFGYTVVNDVTSREIQSRHKQWFLGKSPDTFCPMGPVLVTADEIDDVANMRLTTTVNGEVRQDALVRDLIFDIPTIIETISASITLQPGDIIATGTPAGVAVGFNPPKYLKAGDVVEVNIDPIGKIVNVVA
jgi:2-keto-4-pentenoate hydratase/2-oxohepta-3-ene-1,7-dioic acid hydratase in catechol pathway